MRLRFACDLWRVIYVFWLIGWLIKAKTVVDVTQDQLLKMFNLLAIINQHLCWMQNTTWPGINPATDFQQYLKKHKFDMFLQQMWNINNINNNQAMSEYLNMNDLLTLTSKVCQEQYPNALKLRPPIKYDPSGYQCTVHIQRTNNS